MVSVAFVCLGNICRSPMAEAVFAHTVETQGLSDKITHIDSFGTSAYHIGENPDRRSVQTCTGHDVPVNHKAQQIFPHHFTKFDYILAMDEANLENLKRIAPRNSTAKVMLFGEFRKSGQFSRIVEDPYYGGLNGFETNFKQVTDFSNGLVEAIQSNL